jgi:hypothetical protein
MTQLRILRYVLSRWDRDLYEADLAAPLGSGIQQTLEREQALRDSLGVVQTIDAEDHAALSERRL